VQDKIHTAGSDVALICRAAAMIRSDHRRVSVFEAKTVGTAQVMRWMSADLRAETRAIRARSAELVARSSALRALSALENEACRRAMGEQTPPSISELSFGSAGAAAPAEHDDFLP
jgi:hypothetical protein